MKLQFRLLFHGRIHMINKKATILLPATFDPYNTVSYIELILENLHTNLITNGTACTYSLMHAVQAWYSAL